MAAVEATTAVSFEPDYSGIAASIQRAQERAQETAEPEAPQRRTAQAHAAILSHYLSTITRSQEQEEERQVFSDLVQEQAGTPESDAQRKLLRARARTRVHASAIPRSAPSLIAERRGLLAATVDNVEILFRDVPTDVWFAPYVASLIEEDIAQGYKDEEGHPTGEFGVANPVTHAEVLKMALEASSEDLTDLSPRHGVPRNRSAQGTWAASYIAKAEQEAYSLFSADRNVHDAATRGEVIQTILEVMRVPTGIRIPSSYSDVPEDHPFVSAITTATAYGLVEGDTDANGNSLSTFRPDDPINRAEVSKIVALAKELMR